MSVLMMKKPDQEFMPDVFDTIIQDLKRIRAARGSFGVFGEVSHGYAINPPLSAEELTAFEAKHRIQLPGDYRQFLTRVGNGGAGPYYGLFKLGEMDFGVDCGPWTDFVGDLSLPFPHLDSWNDLTGKPDGRLPAGSDVNELAYEAFTNKYWDPSQISGAFPICHLGCALRQLLIITGPEAGHVWSDNRADEKGLSPLKSLGRVRTTFFQWYRDWLDVVLAKMQLWESNSSTR
jgi:hypothetical protein